MFPKTKTYSIVFPLVCMLVVQLCLTLCDHVDYRLPGSSDHGLLQARILEWVAIPFSRGSFPPRSPALQADCLSSEPPGGWPSQDLYFFTALGSLSARFLCPWNSPGKNTGVGTRSLLQGIFPTQGSNPHLPHCRRILYQLGHQGSPQILEWAAYSFSRGSSQPRN